MLVSDPFGCLWRSIRTSPKTYALLGGAFSIVLNPLLPLQLLSWTIANPTAALLLGAGCAGYALKHKI
jgi:hypothetical protein